MSNGDVLLVIWFLANLLTGMAYFHIPYEIWQWVRGKDLAGFRWIAAMFIAFIVLCGSHHIVMLRHAVMHPTDLLQVVVDTAMAFVSVGVGVMLYHLRPQIRGIILRLL